MSTSNQSEQGFHKYLKRYQGAEWEKFVEVLEVPDNACLFKAFLHNLFQLLHPDRRLSIGDSDTRERLYQWALQLQPHQDEIICRFPRAGLSPVNKPDGTRYGRSPARGMLGKRPIYSALATMPVQEEVLHGQACIGQALIFARHHLLERSESGDYGSLASLAATAGREVRRMDIQTFRLINQEAAPDYADAFRFAGGLEEIKRDAILLQSEAGLAVDDSRIEGLEKIATFIERVYTNEGITLRAVSTRHVDSADALGQVGPLPDSICDLVGSSPDGTLHYLSKEDESEVTDKVYLEEEALSGIGVDEYLRTRKHVRPSVLYNYLLVDQFKMMAEIESYRELFQLSSLPVAGIDGYDLRQQQEISAARWVAVLTHSDLDKALKLRRVLPESTSTRHARAMTPTQEGEFLVRQYLRHIRHGNLVFDPEAGCILRCVPQEIRPSRSHGEESCKLADIMRVPLPARLIDLLNTFADDISEKTDKVFHSDQVSDYGRAGNGAKKQVERMARFYALAADSAGLGPMKRAYMLGDDKGMEFVRAAKFYLAVSENICEASQRVALLKLLEMLGVSDADMTRIPMTQSDRDSCRGTAKRPTGAFLEKTIAGLKGRVQVNTGGRYGRKRLRLIASHNAFASYCAAMLLAASGIRLFSGGVQIQESHLFPDSTWFWQDKCSHSRDALDALPLPALLEEQMSAYQRHSENLLNQLGLMELWPEGVSMATPFRIDPDNERIEFLTSKRFHVWLGLPEDADIRMFRKYVVSALFERDAEEFDIWAFLRHRRFALEPNRRHGVEDALSRNSRLSALLEGVLRSLGFELVKGGLQA